MCFEGVEKLFLQNIASLRTFPETGGRTIKRNAGNLEMAKILNDDAAFGGLCLVSHLRDLFNCPARSVEVVPLRPIDYQQLRRDLGRL